MSEAEKLEVTLSAEQAALVREAVAQGDAPNAAAFVAAAVQAKLDRDRSLAELQDLFERKGQSPSREHLAWAREVLGVEDEGER